MKPVYFLMAIHFHQPVGNFDSVFEDVYRKSYQPFLETIEQFPQIKLTFHFTGCLLEWLLEHKPKCLSQVEHLVKRGQIEIMTGGFYEPILSAIPRNDSLGQIKMLSDFLKRRFNYQPKGAWVAERVWEPHLASVFAQAGVKFVVLDDSHLRYSGLSSEKLYGYYMTEDNGGTVAVFPSDKKLRYLIPFGQVKDVIDYLRSIKALYAGLAAVYGDDAEKFGAWPDTYEWVYKKRWLYNFLNALKENSSWIKTAHISEYLEDNEPLGRVYIPTGSYQEMGEWSLPAESAQKYEGLLDEIKNDGRQDEFLPFLRGGFWRNFLAKYPESNQMHKAMLRVSKKITEAENQEPTTKHLAPCTKHRMIQQARRELYKGQCNCAYWHGIFGGLYLYHLRSAVWEHLIRSEAIADELAKGKAGWFDCSIADFDADSYDEAVLSNPAACVFFDADEGGSITEFSLKAKAVNIVNTLSRRKEAYHADILNGAKDSQNPDGVKSIHNRSLENAPFEGGIFYDWYRRGCLLDHFLGGSTTLENFSRCQYEELGDFVNQQFGVQQTKNGAILTREGRVAGEPVCVTKAVILKDDKADMDVKYEITNRSNKKMGLWFGVEFNFSLTKDEELSQRQGIKELALKDPVSNLAFNLSFLKPASIWRFPITTISKSESGIEENYQSSVVLVHYRFNLLPGQTYDVGICLAF